MKRDCLTLLRDIYRINRSHNKAPLFDVCLDDFELLKLEIRYSLMKNDLGRGERARSLNLHHQWIDLMAMLLMRNDQSLVLYRRRTQLARAASPPAA
ncbi:MAG: hypothetical protein O3B90_02340 [Actinomycetota bacterium]|nr:hypothetical protein [Actinomycetota bacterium]